MEKKEKPKKVTGKKKAAKVPPKEVNPNQFEAFESVLTRLVTPVSPHKQ